MGPKAGQIGAKNPAPTGIFLYSLVLCTSSVLLSLSLLPCILPFVFTYNTQHKRPCAGGIRTRNPSKRSAADPRLRTLSLCTVSVLLCPDCPGFSLLSLLCKTHNTNIHAHAEIRSCNPRQRAVADLHLRPRDHWDRRDSIPRPTDLSLLLHKLHFHTLQFRTTRGSNQTPRNRSHFLLWVRGTFAGSCWHKNRPQTHERRCWG